jgi:hypothetical protein
MKMKDENKTQTQKTATGLKVQTNLRAGWWNWLGRPPLNCLVLLGRSGLDRVFSRAPVFLVFFQAAHHRVPARQALLGDKVVLRPGLLVVERP